MADGGKLVHIPPKKEWIPTEDNIVLYPNGLLEAVQRHKLTMLHVQLLLVLMSRTAKVRDSGVKNDATIELLHSMLPHYIKPSIYIGMHELKKSGLITSPTRGRYQLNPYIAWKGKLHAWDEYTTKLLTEEQGEPTP